NAGSEHSPWEIQIRQYIGNLKGPLGIENPRALADAMASAMKETESNTAHSEYQRRLESLVVIKDLLYQWVHSEDHRQLDVVDSGTNAENGYQIDLEFMSMLRRYHAGVVFWDSQEYAPAVNIHLNRKSDQEEGWDALDEFRIGAEPESGKI